MPIVSPFSDPLAGWPNDDLLLSQEARDDLEATRPELLRIFYWPGLCDKFRDHDGPASRGKTWTHRQGIWSVLLSGFGVVMLGVIPVLPATWSGCVIKIALLSMCIGGLMGIFHWGLFRSRHYWLGHRFWTERLRQLHFQSLANNVQLAAKAVTDDDSFKELVRQRAIWLSELYSNAKDPRGRIRAILEDRIEAGTWIRHEWKARPAAPAEPAHVNDILEGLYRLRIGIQKTYADNNLGTSIHEPRTRSIVLKIIVNLCFFTVAVIAGVGFYSAIDGKPIGLDAASWTIAAGVISAFGLIAQSINQGLQNDAELDRYEWYAEELEQIKHAYDQAPDDPAKVDALRRLEEVSYRELRLFLRSHSAARFTG